MISALKRAGFSILVIVAVGCDDSVEVDCTALTTPEECDSETSCLFTSPQGNPGCYMTCSDGDASSCPDGTVCSEETITAEGETGIFFEWLCIEE